jgi:hypothetical protein
MAPTQRLKRGTSSARGPASAAAPVPFVKDEVRADSTFSPLPSSHRSYSECTPMDIDPSSQGTPTPTPTPLVIDLTGDDEPPTAQYRARRLMQLPPVHEPVVQHTEPSPQVSGTRTADTRTAGKLDIFMRRLSQLEEGHRNHVTEVKGCFTQLSERMDQAESQRKEEEKNRRQQREEDLRLRKEEREEDLRKRKEEREEDLRQRREEREQDLGRRRGEEQNSHGRHCQLVGLLAQGIHMVHQNMGGSSSATSYRSHIRPFSMPPPPAAGPSTRAVPRSANRACYPATSPRPAYDNPRNSKGRRRRRSTTHACGAGAHTPSASTAGIAARGTGAVPDGIPTADGATGPVHTINSATRVYSTTATQTQHSPSPEASSSTAPGSRTDNRPESRSSGTD